MPINSNDVKIKLLTSIQSKIHAISSCDSAFDNPVMLRENSSVLLEKIHANGIFICAYLEEPVGYAVLYANDFQTRTAFLTLLAVDSEFQTMGIGKKLMQMCLLKAYENGMQTIRLEVKKNNHKAISFYKKFGFTMTGKETANSLYMEKTL